MRWAIHGTRDNEQGYVGFRGGMPRFSERYRIFKSRHEAESVFYRGLLYRRVWGYDEIHPFKLKIVEYREGGKSGRCVAEYDEARPHGENARCANNLLTEIKATRQITRNAPNR